MAEYWKSTPKYWCKQCQIYVRDTAFEKAQHEATGKHQGNLKRFLRDIHRSKEREERESQRTKNEVERLRNLVSGKPAAPRTDAAQTRPLASSHAPRQATAEDRKKQMAQLAEMGVAVPEEYQRDMAIAGQWKTVSERRITPVENEEDGETRRLSVGVRKRKHEGEEEEDEEAHIENKNIRKGWGAATRDYPGATDENDDLDALLSKTKVKKRDNDAESDTKSKLEDVQDNPEEKTAWTKVEPESAEPAKEETDSQEASQVQPAEGEPQETAPAVVFKKRKNKAAKR
ncbi:putative formin binding protein [Talaromyces proteolyticus]|uniref:Formin binding protein n=1 Tax=Talaromyces proteolyticus TaxID=1131652 RepID=A0AAD4KSU4_9EURO|nr:putative formin binding protein [Talaromyces proteolyticus]KAH8697557.1 putative formin binding protein [Talaromyces proteolyticus]